MLAPVVLGALALVPAPTRPALRPHREVSTSPQMLSLGPAAALAFNGAASSANAIFYVSPLRNKVIKTLFGVPAQDVLSPTAGLLMYLGGLHAAVAIQCFMALCGLRHAKQTLLGMAILHAIQAAIGLFRMRQAKAAGRAASLDELLGAGGGPATAALLLGAASIAGFSVA